jgi:tRNA A37 threonylcarbamoyladenosine biosynthesis protein TsaE
MVFIDLGAGKTTFARAFIAWKIGMDEGQGHALKVTSPTYLLSNTYCYHDEITKKMEE